MDRTQTLKTFGYSFEELPNLKKIPKMTYVNKEGKEFPNLPADAYHLKRYLSRGLRPKDYKPIFVCRGNLGFFSKNWC